jgi:hypothetical protein
LGLLPAAIEIESPEDHVPEDPSSEDPGMPYHPGMMAYIGKAMGAISGH